MAIVCACGPEPQSDTAGAGTRGTSSNDAGGTSSGGLDLPTGRCGDGVVDPGEACDDGEDGCDACTAACTSPVAPPLAWSAPLTPMEDVLGFDLAHSQRAWVVGESEAGGVVVQRVEPSGQVTKVDFTALADAWVVAFHVNRAHDEVGVLGGLPGGTLMLVRAGIDGPIGEPLLVAKADASRDMAITSVGVSFADYERVTTLSWTGELLANFEGPLFVHLIDAVGDRLALGGPLVTLVDPDGANRVETACGGGRLATTETRVLFDGSEHFDGEEAIMGSCELATGESVKGVVARGLSGNHFGPATGVVDAAPNGNPIGSWSVCTPQDQAVGCIQSRTWGFGGPGEPRTIELDACDEPRHARLGSDRGVYMIRRDRETGAPSLVRRATLPVAPPWG